jgi:glycosyltransferase involved in cell wall biosynthesis
MIRVLVLNKKFKGGPSVFRNRIAQALDKIDDIKVVRNTSDKFDIELAVIRILHKHNRPKILRVDGCYYTEGQHRSANKELINAMRSVDHVVFQSYFSKKMCYNILGMKPRSRSIIRNGIDFSYIDDVAPNPDIKSNSFVACSMWRDSKRPISMIKGFLEAGVKIDFYIIGDGVDRAWHKKHRNIHVLGKKSEQESIAIMKRCKWMIHLCYIDSCPNVVVEGLSCGLSVLCTNLGGTKELVKDNGVVLEVDKWNGKPQKPRRLDSLSPGAVAAGIHVLLKKKIEPRSDELNMKRVAEQYAELIRRHVR